MAMKTFFISDHHFGHKNIIQYTSRWFGDVSEMNKFIVEEHNRVVSKGDLVYCLGDFCWSNKEVYKHFTQQLNGRLHLIAGNHDKSHSYKWLSECGFEQVSMFPIIIDDFWLLSHEPIAFVNETMPCINIHGHTHDECFDSNQRVNVCVEVQNYKPIEFDEIKALYA